ncbi:MAG: ROK family protein [Tannerellaceae bacterium]|jgi:glucokinase|nr:ROK family protein [Tannerellaceae bacterium]
MYKNDQRIVMTLDAGGTNLAFSAIQAGKELIEPIILPTSPDNLTVCLDSLIKGFGMVRDSLVEAPVAISFAFPGPADYAAGIIGDLPNFPAFRGGVALGPFLEKHFGIPVFINNDGNLFAYGEALTGILPEINRRLHKAGSIRQYKNLIGITLGTGFGAGVVINGQLLTGDNGAGGDVWCLRNKKYPNLIAEESVSIRAVRHIYRKLSGDSSELTPKDIFDIAEGTKTGDRNAAVASLSELGEMAGDVLSTAVTLIDGIIVIGGGLASASKYILPALLKEMNGTLSMLDGSTFNRLQMKVFNLNDEEQFKAFVKGETLKTAVPGTEQTVDYDPQKRIGIIFSKQGTNRSVSMGAYVYALNHLNN